MIEITVPIETLQKAVELVSPVAGRRSVSPILGHVLFQVDESGSAWVSATDLEQWLAVRLHGVYPTPGAFSLPATKLMTALAKRTGMLTLRAEEKSVSFETDDADYTLPSFSADEFPFPPKPDGALTTTRFPIEALTSAFQRVIHAASKEQMRPALVGVSIRSDLANQTTRVAATDTHRLAVQTIPFAFITGPGVIVPTNAVNTITRVFRTEIVQWAQDEKFLWLETDSIRYTTALVQSEYPNYERIIPPEFETELELPREAWATATARLKNLAGDTPKVVLTVENEKLLMTLVHDTIKAVERIELVAQNGTFEPFALNVNYLAQALNALEGETARIKINAPLKPIQIEDPNDQSALELIMPMAAETPTVRRV